MNRTVLITGASRGIGRATALAFAKAGWRVAANYQTSTAQAERLLAELVVQTDAALFQADVSDSAAVTQMVAEVSARFGRIDLLINNAGISQQKLFTDLTDEDWARMFAVHVNGTFYTCRAVLPQMLRRQSGGILNLSSIWGMTGASCEVHYAAAKAAVIGLTKALAKEVGPSGITVNCVAPGVIETDMLAAFDADDRAALCAQTPLGRLGHPEEVAKALLFLADAPFVTGQVLSPNGGFVI